MTLYGSGKATALHQRMLGYDKQGLPVNGDLAAASGLTTHSSRRLDRHLFHRCMYKSGRMLHARRGLIQALGGFSKLDIIRQFPSKNSSRFLPKHWEIRNPLTTCSQTRKNAEILTTKIGEKLTIYRVPRLSSCGDDAVNIAFLARGA